MATTSRPGREPARRPRKSAPPAPPEQPEPRYHHGDLHAALLAAAERILETEGLEGLSLRAAARAVGVSHAAPKNHFGDLTGLLSELAAIGFRQFTATLRRAEGFKGVGRAYVEFALAHRAMFLLMFRGERLDTSRPALGQAIAESRQALAESAAASVGLPSGTPPGRAQLARMIGAWALVHGFAMLLIDGRLDTALRNWPDGPEWESLLAAVLNPQ
jgi:AcrR family transcriptional regulator